MPPRASGRAKLRAYLELIRLPAVFTAPADVLAGAALATLAGGRAEGVPWGPLVCLIGASAAIYCAGMATNDLFDLPIDRAQRPARPLPSGRISPSAAWGLALGLQGLALGLAGWLGWPSLIAAGGTIAATYAYNGLKGRLGRGGPLLMGACRYGNAMIGATAVAELPGWPGWAAWTLPAGTATYVVVLTAISRREVHGGVPRWLLVALLASAALPIGWAARGLGLPVGWGGVLTALPFLWLLRPALGAWGGAPAAAVRRLVKAGIFGIALIDGALTLLAGQPLLAAITVALLLPGWLVGRWFYST